MTGTCVPMERCYVCGAPVAEGRVLVDQVTAIRLAGVSRSSVQRWMRDGKVECAAGPAGHPRIYLDSLFRDPLYREFEVAR
jgi:hypothetical protein